MGEIGQAVPKLHPKKRLKKRQEMGHFACAACITTLKYQNPILYRFLPLLRHIMQKKSLIWFKLYNVLRIDGLCFFSVWVHPHNEIFAIFSVLFYEHLGGVFLGNSFCLVGGVKGD